MRALRLFSHMGATTPETRSANRSVDALVRRWRREEMGRGELQEMRLFPWWVCDVLGVLFLLGVLLGWGINVLAM